jgi:murein DD-endopeptidase MepM/ murein hydrolase activator NlpD
MTAAAAALCVFSADAWAAPYGGQLELVATHHHAKKAEASSKTTRHKGHAKAAEPSKSRHGKTRHGLRGETSDEPPVHARRGRHHEEAAAEETHARGRRGRHAEEEAAPAERRGRHGRHAKVVSEIKTESGGAIEVGRHDTLESISHDTGVTIPELAKLNHLKKPYRIREGHDLKLPERRYYVVKSGDTIYSLGRKFDVDASDLAGANDMGRRKSLRAGQKLYLPGSAHEAAPPVEEEEAPPPRAVRRPAPEPRYRPPSIVPTIPAPAERPYATPGQQTYNPPPAEAPPQVQQAPPINGPSSGFELTPPARTAAPPQTQGGSRPLIQTSPTPSAGDVAAAGKGKFIWPVSGQVIEGFGPKADGQRSDGLNISGDTGDPVRAAADGEVVYAGDQVPSFGNLVLIKHPGGWVTAYAHMGRILVKNRDQVVQGQEIGVIGQTGQVDRPQLHFEIRYAPSPKDKAAPVDPALVLPQR